MLSPIVEALTSSWLSPWQEMFLMLFGTIICCLGVGYIWFKDWAPFVICENLVIGGTAALGFFTITKSVNSFVIEPLMDGKVSILLGVFLGVLVFARFTRFRWLARYSVATMTGVSLGISIGGTVASQIIAPIFDTITGLVNLDPDPISAVIMVVGFVLVCVYSLYSITYSSVFHTGKLKIAGTISRYYLFLSFGYLLGKTMLREVFGFMSGLLVSKVYMTVVELQALLGA